jgi:hypothetical protein
MELEEVKQVTNVKYLPRKVQAESRVSPRQSHRDYTKHIEVAPFRGPLPYLMPQVPKMEIKDLTFALLVLVLLWSDPSLIFSYSSLL